MPDCRSKSATARPTRRAASLKTTGSPQRRHHPYGHQPSAYSNAAVNGHGGGAAHIPYATCHWDDLDASVCDFLRDTVADQKALARAMEHSAYNIAPHGGPNGYQDAGVGDGCGSATRFFAQRKNCHANEPLCRLGTRDGAATLCFANQLRTPMYRFSGQSANPKEKFHRALGLRKKREAWDPSTKEDKADRQDPLLRLLKENLVKKGYINPVQDEERKRLVPATVAAGAL